MSARFSVHDLLGPEVWLAQVELARAARERYARAAQDPHLVLIAHDICRRTGANAQTIESDLLEAVRRGSLLMLDNLGLPQSLARGMVGSAEDYESSVNKYLEEIGNDHLT